MNIKRLLIALVAGFAFVFAFDMFWHTYLMKDLYIATKQLWRPENPAYLIYMFVSQFLFVLAVAFFWVKVGTSSSSGFVFGCCLGAVMAAPALATHSYMPIPLTISGLWMLAGFIKSLGTSLIVSTLYKD